MNYSSSVVFILIGINVKFVQTAGEYVSRINRHFAPLHKSSKYLMV